MHGVSISEQERYNDVEDLDAETVLLKQIAEGENRGSVIFQSLVNSMPAMRRMIGSSISDSARARTIR